MKISPILNLVASCSAFSGDGRGTGGHSLDPAFDGSSERADSVHLSPAAQAYLGGADAPDANYDSDSSNTGYGSLRYARHLENAQTLP